MEQLFDLIGSWLVNGFAGQCSAYFCGFLMAAVAVALFDDWCKMTRQIRREASVAALEALFALPDTRDSRQRRY
jgi:hypothetical protein